MGSTNNPLPNALSSSSETSPLFPNPSPSTPSSSSTPTPPTTTTTTTTTATATPTPPTTTAVSTTPTTTTAPAPTSSNGAGGAQKRRKSKGSTMTRVEVLRERSRRAREQIRFLRDSHWTLLEHLRLRLREYYWIHGISPILHNPSSSSPPPVPDQSIKEEELGGGGGGGSVSGCGAPLPLRVCAFPGCKLKPMELTSYCHQHILSDPNQTLYKPCSFVIKSGATGPVLCWKPVLRSMTPSLCSIHLQKAQKHVSHALKKAGLNLTSPNRTAPKFHVLIAEYVRQIQLKRKEAKKAASDLAKSEGKKVS